MDVHAQKVKTIEGEYTYYAPDNVSPAEARKIALERAMNEALANEFGTIVSQSNSTIVKNENGNSSADFVSIGGTEVKGEWIETIGQPEFKTIYEQDMLVINVRVKGKAREITSIPLDLDARVLRNGIDKRFESVDFKNNDDIYLYFRSPENGYLAVFLLDEQTTDVSCMLPYQGSRQSTVSIKRGKQYVFFSEETCEKDEQEYVENYVMQTTNEVEHNTMYIIFSPNKFTTPVFDKQYLDVNCMTYKEYNKWLTSLRIHDKELNVKAINIKISK